MRIGNLHSGTGQLQEAIEKLTFAWEQTKESWRDQRAASFEKEVMAPLTEEIGLALPAISRASQAMGAAVRECEE